MQAKPRLGPQDAPNGFFDARPRNPAGLHGVAQRLERGIRHWRHQHAIGPRQNRAHGGLARRVTRRDAAHVHRVGDDQAPITKLFAQQPGQNLGGEGRRNVRVGLYCGNGKMARHDRADARRNRGAERRQLERLKPLAARADHRQIEMRVRRRISVTRKMLGRGQRAIFLHAAHKLRHEFRHASRVFTERARVDDRIARIVVDVRDGRVNPIHSRGAGFESGDFAHRVGVLRSAARGNRHLRRKRCAFVEPHRGPALEIGGDEQRNLRFRLQLVREHRRRVSLALHHAQGRALRDHNEAADAQIVDVVLELGKRRMVARDQAAMIGREKELTDHLLIGHFPQSCLDPFFGFGGKRARRRFRRSVSGSNTGCGWFLLKNASAAAARVVGHEVDRLAVTVTKDGNDEQKSGVASFHRKQFSV